MPAGAFPAARVRDYLRLFRVHHYIKNLLVFVPLLFSLRILDPEAARAGVLGFVFFSLLSSIVYIVNDLRDIEKDRLHPVKRLRPLASGAVTARGAAVSCAVLAALAAALGALLFARTPSPARPAAAGLALLYAALNIGYSFGLKNIPILDITILASGYVIRVLFGAALINIEVSVWLYLTVTLGAFFLGLGKRRNELRKNGATARKVQAFYSHNFLDKCMYMCQGLCVVFYALWSIDSVTVTRLGTGAFVYTIPLVLIILFKYDLTIESEASEGDPVQVMLGDKALLLLCAAYVAWAAGIVLWRRGTL
ncbi:MAG: UbiA family prenyltransferase [Treponematales bacterium]